MDVNLIMLMYNDTLLALLIEVVVVLLILVLSHRGSRIISFVKYTGGGGGLL